MLMKQKKLIWVLVIEAAACIAFCLLQANFSGIFSTITAFPFEQIGRGLRCLSLSGPAGNAAAILLYLLLSLFPVAVWFLLKKKQKIYEMDYLLFGMSILLFIVLYYMINPGLFRANVPGTVKYMLGCTFYSVFFGYLVLRILKTHADAGVEKLQSGLKMLLYFLNIIFIYIVCGQNFGTLTNSIQKMADSSQLSGIETELFLQASECTWTYLFLILHYAVSVLPYLLNIVVVFLAIRMLNLLSADRYSEEAVAAAKKLADFCVKALAATIITDAAFNILQMIFHKRLYEMDIVIVVPVFSTVFVLAVLLFARYIQEGQKLKQDNDLFI